MSLIVADRSQTSVHSTQRFKTKLKFQAHMLARDKTNRSGGDRWPDRQATFRPMWKNIKVTAERQFSNALKVLQLPWKSDRETSSHIYDSFQNYLTRATSFVRFATRLTKKFWKNKNKLLLLSGLCHLRPSNRTCLQR